MNVLHRRLGLSFFETRAKKNRRRASIRSILLKTSNSKDEEFIQLWKETGCTKSYHACASRTDARRQRSVHVDDGGGLRAGDAEPLKLVTEEETELLEYW